MESRKMCKMWVWTAPAWSDCMYTLPKNISNMELEMTIFSSFFETFTEEGQSCCQGMSMGCQGAPGASKRCQGMSMGCQGGALGYEKDAKESNSTNNAEARGENLRWMAPRCVPDASQILPRFFPNACQTPPRNLPS